MLSCPGWLVSVTMLGAGLGVLRPVQYRTGWFGLYSIAR